jgi:hypothetical protein
MQQSERGEPMVLSVSKEQWYSINADHLYSVRPAIVNTSLLGPIMLR